jgi:hypothetical protein
LFIDYAAFGATGTSTEIAITGHTPAQVPQEMHFVGSIQYLPSFGEIAITGHTPAQVPQEMHFVGSIL